MNNTIINNRILLVTPNNDEQLYNYMKNKFSPCMVPNEPIKGFKIEIVYSNKIEDLK